MKAPSGVPVPPPRAGHRPTAEAGAHEQRRSYPRRHPARVRAITLVASVAIHLLVFYLPSSFDAPVGSPDAFSTSATAPLAGIEIVNLIESDAVASPEEPDVSLQTATSTPTVSLPGAPGDDLEPRVRIEAPDPGPTAAERLRPATRTEELWIPLTVEATTLSDQELIHNLVYRRLAEFNDSMAVRAARAARGTDWTYTDDEGNRWGVSPGQLHLGSITIPLPFSFGTPGGASGDRLDQLLMEREIQRAAGLLETDRTIRERAAAIKARIDEERARRGVRPDSVGGGPP